MPLPAPSAQARPTAAPALFGPSRLALPVAVALAVAGRMLLPVDGGAEIATSASASAETAEPGLPPRATRPPQPRPPQPRPSTVPAALPPAPGGLWPLAPEPAALFLPTPLLAEPRVAGVAGADPAEGADPAL